LLLLLQVPQEFVNVRSHDWLEAPHFLLRKRFADYAALDAVQALVEAVEDAVDGGFDLAC
jgi:hypothetical protein